MAEIQHAPSDRVAAATLNVIFPGQGAAIMAIADYGFELPLHQRADSCRGAGGAFTRWLAISVFSNGRIR